MPFIPLPMMDVRAKKKKKPKGWRAEKIRHSLARKGIKTGKKTRQKKKSLFPNTKAPKIYKSFMKSFSKSAKISQDYQEKIDKDRESSYLARGMYGAGAFGGGVLGLFAGIMTGVPPIGLAGLLTGGMAGATLALTAYDKLPKRIKRTMRVDVKKEDYEMTHLPPNILGLVPVSKKVEKRFDKALEDFHIPYEKQIGKYGEQFFEKAFFWYTGTAEKSEDDWLKSEDEIGKEMISNFMFWKKKKKKKKTKKKMKYFIECPKCGKRERIIEKTKKAVAYAQKHHICKKKK